MRLKINFSKNTSAVPINNQDILNTYIHKCLGKNNKWHNTTGIYSISSLQGGKLNSDKRSLDFANGSYIIVSACDDNMDFLDTLIDGINQNVNFTHGMEFIDTDCIKEDLLNGWNHFATLSPFLIKERTEKHKYSFITLNDINFNEKVKQYLINRLNKENIKIPSDFDVFIPQHNSHKVKSILVKNVINKANQCQISIKCSKEIADFIYHIGLGNSCGSGFGILYKTGNRCKYLLGEDLTKYLDQKKSRI